MKRNILKTFQVVCFVTILVIFFQSYSYADQGYDSDVEPGMDTIDFPDFPPIRTPIPEIPVIKWIFRRQSDGSLFVKFGIDNAWEYASHQIRLCTIGNYHALTDNTEFPDGASLRNLVNTYKTRGVNCSQSWLMFRWNEYGPECSPFHSSVIPYNLAGYPLPLKYDLEDANSGFWDDRVGDWVGKAVNMDMPVMLSLYVPHDAWGEPDG